jgi:uncharacterized membrane protein
MPVTAEKGAPVRNRRIAVLAISFLLIVLGFASLLTGVAMGFLNQTATDAEGYYLSDPYHVSTSAYVFMFPMVPAYDPSDSALTKWLVTSTNPDKELFVGWGSTLDTGPYLTDVQFETPFPDWEWEYGWYWSTLTVATTQTWNTAPPKTLPSQENFWMDSAQTSGNATIPFDIHWDNATTGNRALLIMNTDGTANVQADLQFGAKIPTLTWMPFVLVPVGFVLAFVGLAVFRRRARWYASKSKTEN